MTKVLPAQHFLHQISYACVHVGCLPTALSLPFVDHNNAQLACQLAPNPFRFGDASSLRRRFPARPPVLAGASHLHTLNLMGVSEDFKLTASDVDGILLRLPQLHRLRMPWRQAETIGALAHLFHSLPQLEELDESV
ncbi:hypothetical protein ABPG75_012921 [Micractinium tetrahymenae]